MLSNLFPVPMSRRYPCSYSTRVFTGVCVHRAKEAELEHGRFCSCHCNKPRLHTALVRLAWHKVPVLIQWGDGVSRYRDVTGLNVSVLPRHSQPPAMKVRHIRDFAFQLRRVTGELCVYRWAQNNSVIWIWERKKKSQLKYIFVLHIYFRWIKNTKKLLINKPFFLAFLRNAVHFRVFIQVLFWSI